MKNKKCAAALLLSSSLLALSACGNGSENEGGEEKDAYDFCYNVNYEGGANRIDSIKAGETASSWSAKRKGYALVNWYTDSSLSEAYDFSLAVNADTTIYAKWVEKAETKRITVTFDYNYEGSLDPYSVTTYSNSYYPIDNVPIPTRFGYSPTGWFKEKECINKWSFSTDILSDSMTLYAGYESAGTVNRDANGQVVFDNVTISFAPNVTSWGDSDVIDELMIRFNKEYSGQISVNKVSYNEGEDVTLEDTGFINQAYGDYYNAGDVLNAIGLGFDEDDYYPSAIRSSYMYGALKTVPMFHIVPFLVYDRQWLSYCGLSEFPSTHQEIYDWLVKCNEENEESESWEGAFASSANWSLYEIGSHLIWSNNDFDFFDYENGEYTNGFSKESNKEKLTNAFKGGSRIFGYESPVNAGYSVHSAEAVGYQHSALGVCDQSGDLSTVLNAFGGASSKTEFIDRFGIASAKNLTNYGNVDEAKVFAKEFAFGIRATTTDLYKVAASAVFANWMSKNAGAIGERYCYPASKTAQESEDFALNGDFAFKVVRAGVDPSSVITQYGHKNNYSMFNYLEQSYLDSVTATANLTDDTIDGLIDAFASSLQDYLEE